MQNTDFRASCLLSVRPSLRHNRTSLSRGLLITAVLIAIFATPVPVVSASDGSAGGKISARLLSETTNGGQTEALIVLVEQADLTAASSLPTKLDKGRYVFQALQDVAERTQAPLRSLLQQRGIPFQSFYIVNMIKVTADRDLLRELAARSDVAHIDANPQVSSPLLGTPGTGMDSGGSGVEWNVQRVNAPQVWALGYRGEGLVVAGNDTGVKWDHPSLKSHYRGWNGSTVNHNYNWHDATSQHSPVPIDPNYHGTFTASEMVGDDGMGNQVGVAPGAKWIACRNMDVHGTGSPAQYIECFQFLMAPYPVNGNPSQGDPAKAPDSINNSWACPASEGCTVSTLKSVVDAVRAAGIFPAMATGNSGPNCSTVSDPPEFYASSVSLGATDSYNQIALFSSRGPVIVDGSHRTKPDLSAPGVNIRGAIPYLNMYQGYWSGTSMAAPHLAGGVALLWQAKPELIGDIDTTEAVFTQSAHHLIPLHNCGIGLVPNGVYGWGLLDLLNAVQSR
jgi:serine protease AprX